MSFLPLTLKCSYFPTQHVLTQPTLKCSSSTKLKYSYSKKLKCSCFPRMKCSFILTLKKHPLRFLIALIAIAVRVLYTFLQKLSLNFRIQFLPRNEETPRCHCHKSDFRCLFPRIRQGFIDWVALSCDTLDLH
jgi:hypothetical protein